MIDANEYKNTKEKFINLLKDKNLDIETSEENILTYTLFPEIGFKFLENKDNQDFFEKSPTKLTEDKEGYYNVEIDDSSYLVKYSKTESPEIICNNETLPVKRNEISKNVDGTTVNAPLGGNIFSIEYSEGSSIKEDDTVIVLEAMKMETTIKTPVNGTIKKIFVKNGDKVQAGEPLFEVVN
jgi:oxaloacetate decarboxylase alpha subunit